MLGSMAMGQFLYSTFPSLAGTCVHSLFSLLHVWGTLCATLICGRLHKAMQRRCGEPTVHHCTFGQHDILREAHSLA